MSAEQLGGQPVDDLGQVDHIALIGLMGSGKSAVGGALARRLGRPLVDVDRVILGQTGMSVQALWERGGEVAYRPLERDAVMHTLAGEGPDVLAVPAGATEDHLVREAFAAADVFTVWLRAEVATLVSRAAASSHRPLLGDQPDVVLSHQQDARAATYEALADLTLNVGDRSIGELVMLIVDAMPR